GRLPRNRVASGRVIRPDTRRRSKLAQLITSVVPNRDVSMPAVSALAHGIAPRVESSTTLIDDGLDEDEKAKASRCASGERRMPVTLAPAGDGTAATRSVAASTVRMLPDPPSLVTIANRRRSVERSM